MCSKPTCMDKNAKLMNRLTDEPETHDWIVIEWIYIPAGSNYSYGTVSSNTTINPLGPQTTVGGAATNNPPETSSTAGAVANYSPVPYTPMAGGQYLVRASKIMCSKCKKIEPLNTGY